MGSRKPPPCFRDRRHAGDRLADQLAPCYAGAVAADPDLLVLALPRGGVPVGFAVAQALRAPLDVFVVRKLGAPDQPELAIGAIASGGVRVVNVETVRTLGLSPAQVDAITAREQRELERRERAYRDGRPGAEVRGRTVLLVDDGLATGATMRAALGALRQCQPARLVVAVPVAAEETCRQLRTKGVADAVVCVHTPPFFHAVGQCYEDFSQVTDAEVRGWLRRAATAAGEGVTVTRPGPSP